MTVTNMCYNFVGFGCSPPLISLIMQVVFQSEGPLPRSFGLRQDGTHTYATSASQHFIPCAP